MQDLKDKLAAHGRNPSLGVSMVPAQAASGSWLKNLGRSKIDLSCPRDLSWWTGKLPESCPGFFKRGSAEGALHAIDIPNLNNCTRQQVRDYFDNGWAITESLFASLVTEEAFYRPPYHDLRHPMVFYYAHPAVLYINKLRLAGLIDNSVDEYIEGLFETGVDEMSWDDMAKNQISWPKIDDLFAYRKSVYAVVTSLIESHPGLALDHDPITMNIPLWALFLGFEHERIHIETSSVLMRELPLHLVQRSGFLPPPHPSAPKEGRDTEPASGVDFPVNSFVQIEAGRARIGKPLDFPTFGWDNEYGGRDVNVDRFEVTRNLISNGEFREFVAAGGYQSRKYWSETGWRWRSFRNVKWPTFWCPSGPAGSNQFELRTCFEILPMPWSWPAVVNFHEAQAYAQWLKEKEGSDSEYGLLTEAQHYRLRQVQGHESESLADLVVPYPSNLNLRFGSESPVGGNGEQDALINDVFGNVWQWLEDHFYPLDGFDIHKYYDDFSTPCFDGEHQMIVGGSFVSIGDEATAFARFHFRPHFFQHAGFRLVRRPSGSDNAVVHLDTTGTQKQKPDELASELASHYCASDVFSSFSGVSGQLAGHPQRVVDWLISYLDETIGVDSHVLEVGSSVGGVSILLAEKFSRVTGVELNEHLVEQARLIKAKGRVDIDLVEEGELKSSFSREFDSDCLARVDFLRCDPGSLPADFIDFDALVVSDVLTRMPSPKSFLSRLSGSRGLVK
ncbi:MAG: 5-histidylcysteine sulfoxide synthase, partial [Candidatus Obscuribacterales bacterium]|nr:5-histidylcysteine sulfoxide synthase [Candidatus Obscuribacterales bacterium]